MHILRMLEAPHGTRWEISTSSGDDAWDSFVESQPMGHHEQTSMWGEVKSAYGWESLRLILKEKDQILGGVQFLRRRLGPFGSIGYVCKGPVIADKSPGNIQCVIRAMHAFAKFSRILYLAVELPYDGHDLVGCFDDLGYLPVPKRLPPSGLTRATQIIDLSQTTDEILSKMRSSTRANIRRGIRRGIAIAEATGPEWSYFRPLMLTVCTRRNSTPTPAQKDFFDRLSQIFGQRKRVAMILAKLGDKIISAAVVFAFGKYVRQWKVGWTGTHSDLFPNDSINWGVINWAKERGFRYYENIQLNFENAKRIAEGRTLLENEWDPTTFFKMGFGGQILLLPEPRAYFFNPMLRAAAKAIC